MTYNLFSGTLNPTQSINQAPPTKMGSIPQNCVTYIHNSCTDHWWLFSEISPGEKKIKKSSCKA